MIAISSILSAIRTALVNTEVLAIALNAPSTTTTPEGEEEPVTTYDSSALIHCYADDLTTHRSLAEAVDSIATGEILIAHMGLSLGVGGEETGWRHQVALFYKPATEAMAHAIIAAIVDGVPSASPVRLTYMQFVSGLEPMDATVFSRASNSDGVEYWTCTFGLAETWN